MVSASEPSTRAAVRPFRGSSAILGGMITFIGTLAEFRVWAVPSGSRAEDGVRQRSPEWAP